MLLRTIIAMRKFRARQSQAGNQQLGSPPGDSTTTKRTWNSKSRGSTRPCSVRRSPGAGARDGGGRAMRRFLFWLLFHVRLGPLAPWVLGLALGRRAKRVKP